MLRPLGKDNTVLMFLTLVDVFNTMTQAQVDLKNQLEQATSDLTTRPLLNDPPVLYIVTSEPRSTTSLEQKEQEKIEHDTSKVSTPLNDIDHAHATPPPPKKRLEIMKNPVFLSSPIYPPFISTNTSLCTNRDDHLIPLLSHDDFTFKAQLTYLYMHPTDYSFRLYDKNQDFFTYIASKIMGPCQYWLDNGVKIFSPQFNFLRPSIYDKKTDESDPSFLSVLQKATHHQTYTKYLQHTKPKKYIFVNYKYTSPFTMTNIYTLDHSCITGYLRNYDPTEQYYCLLPYNNTSRPLIVPQEHLIHFDDFLLPCNVPTQIVKPITVIKHLVSSPIDDKVKTYYTVLYKQTYSYNGLLFIAAKTISFMVKAEQKSEHKIFSSPIKNTPEKLSSVLNNRTLRDITNLLDPYKRTPSETPIITHILHCYDRTHKLLQTLDLDFQRITQSSQAIQSALESITFLFNSTNLH